jgi:hypothetical protein
MKKPIVFLDAEEEFSLDDLLRVLRALEEQVLGIKLHEQ